MGFCRLATLDNYHLPRKNASYRFVILRGHLWGERFQKAGVGGRQGDLPPVVVPSFKLEWGSSQARDPGGA